MLITSISGTHTNNTPLDVPSGTRTAARAAACAGAAAGAAAVGTGGQSWMLLRGTTKGQQAKRRAGTNSCSGFLHSFSRRKVSSCLPEVLILAHGCWSVAVIPESLKLFFVGDGNSPHCCALSRCRTELGINWSASPRPFSSSRDTQRFNSLKKP